MKVIHSFVDKLDVMWKEIAYSQYLSAVLAKKHYGNISFYSTPKLVEQIKELGIPYDEYNTDILTADDLDTWSIPKLKVYSVQKEPYLHIDNDSFIFNKIDFKSLGKPYVFAHPDLGGRKIIGTLPNLFDSVVKTVYGEHADVPSFYKDINNTYLRLVFRLFSKTPKDILSNFDLGSIPNMNLVYVEDAYTFSAASNMALSHYYSNKEEIDQEEYGPCYIEQYYIHQALRTLDSNYREYSSKSKNTYFKKLPFSQQDQHNNIVSIAKVSFPLTYNTVSKCPCCNKRKDKKVVIESKSELMNLLEYDFEGFLHTTYMKWYDIMQAVTIHKLRQEIGDNKLRIVYKYFKNIYPKYDLPIKSGGEKLYEKLTGFSFDKVGSYKDNSYI